MHPLVMMGVMAAAGQSGGPQPGPATVVQGVSFLSFDSNTTVGNTVILAMATVGAQPVPQGAGWVEVATRASGTTRVSVWARAVTSAWSSVTVTNSGNRGGTWMMELSGLDNSALGSPLSLHTAQGNGAFPASQFTGITDPYAFGMYAATATAGSGGSPDIYDWYQDVGPPPTDLPWGGPFELGCRWTPDLYNKDQSMSGGGVSSGSVLWISVAFKSAGG